MHKHNMLFSLLVLLGFSCHSEIILSAAEPAEKTERFVLVIGAEGTDQYAEQFLSWANHWKQIAEQKQAILTVIGESVDARRTDRELIERELQREPEAYAATWLILIGHGTFDGKTARFNLRGPDLTAAQLQIYCEKIQHPLAVLNCFSASGPFLQTLSAENRVIISATKNGYEFYFSHFGKFLSEAGAQSEADLDHDGQISLLEAYLSACRQTREYYLERGELETEHAILDDNADQRGSQADQFKGLNRIPEPQSSSALPDGHRAHQFSLNALRRIRQISGEQKQERDALEIKILKLKQRKSEFQTEDEYYRQLEPLMIELAHVYRRQEQRNKSVIHDPLVVPVNAKQQTDK